MYQKGSAQHGRGATQATEITFRDRWVQGHEDDIHRVAEVEILGRVHYELYDDARAAERWVKARRVEGG